MKWILFSLNIIQKSMNFNSFKKFSTLIKIGRKFVSKKETTLTNLKILLTNIDILAIFCTFF